MYRPNRNQREIERRCFRIRLFGITARVALLLFLLVVLPMLLTSWLIESGRLVAGGNVYFAVPIILLFLLIPVARGIAHVLINHDLKIVNRFCKEVKKGNYQIYFDLPNEKEDEDEFLELLRNLTWMSQGLARRQELTLRHVSTVRRQYMDMEEKAFTDSLTGMYNRRYLESLYDNPPRDIYVAGTEISVIYIDCDRFKEVNDTLGHHAGDQLLRDLAHCVRRAIRENVDIPLRLGGDEFAVVLPRTNLAQARKIACRIRHLYNKIKSPCTSLSIGVANSVCTADHGREKFESLFIEADQQAYQIKRSGGDGIACSLTGVTHLSVVGELS